MRHGLRAMLTIACSVSGAAPPLLPGAAASRAGQASRAATQACTRLASELKAGSVEVREPFGASPSTGAIPPLATSTRSPTMAPALRSADPVAGGVAARQELRQREAHGDGAALVDHHLARRRRPRRAAAGSASRSARSPASTGPRLRQQIKYGIGVAGPLVGYREPAGDFGDDVAAQQVARRARRGCDRDRRCSRRAQHRRWRRCRAPAPASPRPASRRARAWRRRTGRPGRAAKPASNAHNRSMQRSLPARRHLFVLWLQADLLDPNAILGMACGHDNHASTGGRVAESAHLPPGAG